MMSSSKKVVLVTGGSGLVGYGLKMATENNTDASDYEIIYLSSKDCDLRDKNATEKVFEKYKPTHVVHLAARVGGLFANMNDQIGFMQDNLHINDNVITLCHKFDVKRAIFCLSTCVYPCKSPLPYTEEMIHNGPPHPTNEGYAHSKRILECLVRYYREAYGHEWVCIIPTNLYGPNDNFHLQDAHVLPALIHKCYLAKKNNTDLQMMGSGTPMRQFLYSHDAGKIIFQLLHANKDRINFSSIILCADEEEEYTIKHITDVCVKAMKFDGNVTWDKTKSDGIHKKTATNARLRSFLGAGFKFTPFNDGVTDTVDWFVNNYDTKVRK